MSELEFKVLADRQAATEYVLAVVATLLISNVADPSEMCAEVRTLSLADNASDPDVAACIAGLFDVVAAKLAEM